MPRILSASRAIGVCALAFTTFTLATTTRPHAQGGGPAGTFQATELAADYLRAAVNDVRRLEDSGALRVASSHEDRLLDGHRHERLQQYHLGLPVVGGSLVRQTADGVVTSILGQLYRGDVASARPGVSSEQAERRLRDGGVTLLFSPALKFLGMDDGGVRLVWEVSVMTDLTDARTVYLDASSGAELLALPLVKDQAAVGEGQGVLGDRKKMSTRSSGGTFYAEDFLRPPVLDTIDIRTNRARLNQIAAGQLAQSDIAVDSDNVWTDPVAVDAHTYLGWTYDYLFKRIGFRGLNNGDTPMYANINIYTPQQCVTTVPATEFGTFCTNAFWAGPPTGPGGRGMMVFGNGIPSNFFLTSSGQTVGPLAGALDIVAHELTHGVTDYTSGLEYRNESGALNESFSDMMGFAAEAYFQPRGTAAMQADYLMGEDSFKASRAGSVSGIRSAQSPTSYGHPDHYSIRYTGSQDNGGVHINSGIPNHVFYLAIEGGTNRVSGQTVTGVGFANREQIERVFFRAMTQMLPVRATFSQARAATIQSARDLYASNTAVVNAVTAAWNAVGVQ